MTRWLDRHHASLVPWLVPVGLLILWQGLSMTGLLAATVLPAPSEVLAAAWRLGRTGELLHHIVISTERAAAGLLVGGGIGLALGLLNGLSPF
ncbi:MAG TPA: ABC transporter permease, partial [Stellaceae bacterium]|nr:ABC transporter permease [Stellaceae bacterium]